MSKATYHGYDQLDDWHYRGTHPILVNMPLYEYSRWVYRIEFSPYALKSAQASRRTPKHIDIPFDEDYVLGKTWVQRLSREERVPRIEGMKFHAEANAEMHYLMKSVLLRPIHPERQQDQNAAADTNHIILLNSYQSFCTSSNADEKWDAIPGSGPGPFQRSYMEFKKSMEQPAKQAKRKRLQALDYPSFWDTQEVHAALQEAATRNNVTAVPPTFADIDANRPTVSEYLAAEFFKIDAHFSGIAAASSGRPPRQITEDQKILEQPMAANSSNEHEGDIYAVDDERVAMGLADLAHNTKIMHRFDDETVLNILQFQMRERYTRFTKELRDMPFMQDGRLPTSSDSAELAKNQQSVRTNYHVKFGGDLNPHGAQGLPLLLQPDFTAFIQQQQKFFECNASTEVEDDEMPPETSTTAQVSIEPKAYFVPDGEWQLPSDYIVHMATEFEAGRTTLPGKKKKKKQLTRDQVLFLVGFADALNTVWQQERDNIPMDNRKEYSFLLMGQGGSGKTAIVQEILLPSIDFIFPPEHNNGSSSIIVCSSWAQAENISTDVFKAMTCHTATYMRPQSYRNKLMQPEGKHTTFLEEKLNPMRALIIEEVSMISPGLYNMLLYRFYHGRKRRYQVDQERYYVQRKWAFGRMPLKVHLGDFLQLPPTAAQSLLTDFNALAHKTEDRDFPPEHQDAQKLFLATEHCYELRSTN